MILPYVFESLKQYDLGRIFVLENLKKNGFLNENEYQEGFSRYRGARYAKALDWVKSLAAKSPS